MNEGFAESPLITLDQSIYFRDGEILQFEDFGKVRHWTDDVFVYINSYEFVSRFKTRTQSKKFQ